MSAAASKVRKYAKNQLNRVAFPLGGIGAGMLCLEGSGALSHFSLRHRPDVFNEPLVFSALHIKGLGISRVIEGPVPDWKVVFPWPNGSAGNGSGGKTYGLPHFANASFDARFPFGKARLSDRKVPLSVEVTGWSPFLPGASDDSSLPVAGLEYTFINHSKKKVEAVYSFHARNPMEQSGEFRELPEADRPAWGTKRSSSGFVLYQEGNDEKPWTAGALCASVDDPQTAVNCRWFRGGWFDPLTLVWKSISTGAVIEQKPYTAGAPSPGGSLYVPIRLKPGESRTVCLRLSWYVPVSNLRVGDGRDDAAAKEKEKADCGCGGSCSPAPRKETYRPWYASHFADVAAVDAYWAREYTRLRDASQAFSDCFYDSTLPSDVIDAVAANLTILKSPTVLRQADGRLWAWEGCCDGSGCCHGTCTHVWNYAQALPHLFPDLERSLRHTEFGESQDERGHQNFRACLPIRPATNNYHAASDGQLGGIMKVFREWRVSGDIAWLRGMWSKVKASLEYCIRTWDPDHEGILREPHHNTYDIEFWGPDGMCGSFYLGALVAAGKMGHALGELTPLYDELALKARAALEKQLFDGEYFIQRIRWRDLNAPDPSKVQSSNSPEAIEMIKREGPKYQYGTGCLSDGVLGAWMAEVCGVGEILDPKKIEKHLLSVFKYNFRKDLSEHANPQRPTYAIGTEAGLLLCSWPKGGALTLPFPYSDEVWTGIEYQVASHLMLMKRVKEGLAIVKAVRERYDGRVRNPFNEFECGHWYARAMSSYGLIQGLTGQRYDAVERVLTLRPQVKGDWRSFICTATGYGTVGMKKGKPFLEVKHGKIEVERIEVLK